LTFLVIALYHEQGFTGNSMYPVSPIFPVSRRRRNPAFVREKLPNLQAGQFRSWHRTAKLIQSTRKYWLGAFGCTFEIRVHC